MDSLDLKHAKSLLIALSKVEEAKKSDFFGIIKSHQVLDNLLNSLQKDNYLIIKESQVGPKKYSISLTPKGRSVAEQLKRAEEAARGVVIHENEGRAEIPASEAEDWAEKFRDATKNLSLLYHVNVFEDHVTIGEEKDGKLRVINVYVKLNGKGMMRLWCEADESFECIHVKYAWTLPKVQEMYANNVRNGKVNGK